MPSDAWKFVTVDPLAPKKRRQRRRPAPPPASPARVPARESPVASTSAAIDAGPQGFDDLQSLLFGDMTAASSWASLPSPLLSEQFLADLDAMSQSGVPSPFSSSSSTNLDDFDRFFILSDGQGVSAAVAWTTLFRDAFQIPWTPLASNGIETALFNFYRQETVKASVSIDDPANAFREAIIPLSATEPAVFHGTLAVAAAHWANRLRHVKAQTGQPDARCERQLHVLDVASAYHRSMAQDLSRSITEADAQAKQESQAAAAVLLGTLGTFVDGRSTRDDTLRLVHTVLRRHGHSAERSSINLFLRMWLKWIDTLDSTAKRRARITSDDQLEPMYQALVDEAVAKTVGCRSDTMRLISAASDLAERRELHTLQDAQRFASDAGKLHGDILGLLEQPPPTSEEQLSSHCFNLALHLFFLTSVQRVRIESDMVRWTAAELMRMSRIASSYRQAWATWPYFMLGVHVCTPEDEAWVLGRFQLLEATLSIGILSSLRRVLEEYWRRRANAQSVDWQDVSMDLYGAIVSPL